MPRAAVVRRVVRAAAAAGDLADALPELEPRMVLVEGVGAGLMSYPHHPRRDLDGFARFVPFRPVGRDLRSVQLAQEVQQAHAVTPRRP